MKYLITFYSGIFRQRNGPLIEQCFYEERINNEENQRDAYVLDGIMQVLQTLHSLDSLLVVIKRIPQQMFSPANQVDYVIFLPVNNARIANIIFSIIFSHSGM